MCYVTGEMDPELLGKFCLRISQSNVSAATTTEIIERCADCVARGDESRESSDVRSKHKCYIDSFIL